MFIKNTQICRKDCDNTFFCLSVKKYFIFTALKIKLLINNNFTNNVELALLLSSLPSHNLRDLLVHGFLKGHMRQVMSYPLLSYNGDCTALLFPENLYRFIPTTD